MNAAVYIYSMDKKEIEKFLNKFFEEAIVVTSNEWSKKYLNPIEMADIIGVYIDNKDNFRINMWICIDEGFLINIRDGNANQIIKYLYERFPY